ncbi:hypothetical protein KUTeg_020704 [Tegillarca granosa]|uniref:Uncharacterized protein n=1 Tax=Tegillarca granosa TaxID=220873 RepID=A0ABQ9E8S8_TEGGR|nr:hypothetical protein KUTeg_020704 [Tegillarca granosa]
MHEIDPEGVEIRHQSALFDALILRKDQIVFGTSIVTIIETFWSMIKRQYRWLISRRIISLNVYHTNNNPRIIGSPCIVRGDCGTENGHVRDIQIFFIETAHNIETALHVWSKRLKAGRDFDTRFWMELFHSMEEEGLNNRDFLDKNLVQFCFMALIQKG